jgi:hypothetical protein
MHTITCIGIVTNSVTNTARGWRPSLIHKSQISGQPFALGVSIHGHEIFIQESNKIDLKFASGMFHQVDNVARTVPTDFPIMGESHLKLPWLSLDVF